MVNYLRQYFYLKVEDITHVKAREGMKSDETIFSTVPQSRKHLIAEISGMFDTCTIYNCKFSWRSTCIHGISQNDGTRVPIVICEMYESTKRRMCRLCSLQCSKIC